MPKKKLPKEQTALLIEDKLVNSNVLSPAFLTKIETAETKVVCATCQQPVRLVLSDSGPIGVHDSEFLHFPEDIIVRKGKDLILERLSDMFPQAKVGCDVSSESPKGFLDFAVVLSNGGKIGIRFLVEGIEITSAKFDQMNQEWEEDAVKILWLLDWRRLKIASSGRKKSNSTVSVTLGNTETVLIQQGVPLVYLDVENRQLIKVMVPAQAAILARKQAVKKLGKLKCFLQRYRIGQLRIAQGSWNLQSEFDSRPPKPPDLPKRLQKKWLELEAETSGASEAPNSTEASSATSETFNPSEAFSSTEASNKSEVS